MAIEEFGIEMIHFFHRKKTELFKVEPNLAEVSLGIENLNTK